MAVNHTARGQQRDKPFRDALRMEIADADGNHKRLRRIATALLRKASEGYVDAIREVADRLDGKVPQAIGGDPDNPVKAELEVSWKSGDNPS
jgi:hypothetical protein